MLSSIYSYSATVVTGSNIQTSDTEKKNLGGNIEVQNSVTMDSTALAEASRKVTAGNTYLCASRNSRFVLESMLHRN